MLSDILFRTIQRLSFIKKTKIFKFTKAFIFPSLVYNISKLFKDDIDQKLIIMGAFGGGAFIDNTKYLFQFLNKNSDNKLIWIAKLKKLLIDMNKKGYKSIPIYSLATIKLLRKAKYIFLTHGYEDILSIKFSPKTTVIFTEHGIPIKNVDMYKNEYSRYYYWMDVFKLRLKHEQYIDYILTPTKNKREREILSTAFQLSPEKIIELGYPRNDILFNNDEDFIRRLKKDNKIPYNTKKIILYAPTYRDDGNLKIPISESGFNELNSLLIEKSSIFLIKGHVIAEKINLNEYKNIIIVEKTADIQELLLISDVLITDYSSVWLDYILTLKPILFFTFDLEDYSKTRGFYYNFKEIVPGPLLFTDNELIGAIQDIEKINRDFAEKRKEIRDRFHKYKDNKSTERLLQFLNIKFN